MNAASNLADLARSLAHERGEVEGPAPDVPAEVVSVEPVQGEGEGEESAPRPTRVFSLNPLASTAAEVITGLEMLLTNLKEELTQTPNLHVQFKMDEEEDKPDPGNDLAKALNEQAGTHDPTLVSVADFSKAVQTAMRKNNVKNCAWVVVLPPVASVGEDGVVTPKEGSAPRFITGGTDRTHMWFRESLELAAAVRMQLAQRQAQADGVPPGMQTTEGGLAVPVKPKLVI